MKRRTLLGRLAALASAAALVPNVKAAEAAPVVEESVSGHRLVVEAALREWRESEEGQAALFQRAYEYRAARYRQEAHSTGWTMVFPADREEA